MFAYDFASNEVPGVWLYEERGYWRDIGTIEAYRAAQRDVLGPLPRFNLANRNWPIHGDAFHVQGRLARPAAMGAAGTRHIETGADANALLAE